jgi:hypothetical protein
MNERGGGGVVLVTLLQNVQMTALLFTFSVVSKREFDVIIRAPFIPALCIIWFFFSSCFLLLLNLFKKTFNIFRGLFKKLWIDVISPVDVLS